MIDKSRKRLEDYLESLIDVAAQGNANTVEFYADDIEKILAGKRPKRTIYIVTENDRYGSETWDLGTPDDITIEWEGFDFDTKYGELDVVYVRAQVERLKELEKLSGHDLSTQIAARLEWLDERKEAEEEVERARLLAASVKIEAARRVLRAAGELPEVPDGATPNDQA